MIRNLGRRITDSFGYVKEYLRLKTRRLHRFCKAIVHGVNSTIDFLAGPGQKPTFEPLTPVLVPKKQSARYESELLSALDNGQVRNIAITGEYGAGKSSLIRTFVERNPQYKYAWVSLAIFGKEGSATPSASDDTDETNSSQRDVGTDKKADADLIDRIEETIVQQLLYSVPAKRLPKTRLKRIVQFSRLWIAGQTTLFLIWSLSISRMYIESVGTHGYTKPAWLIEGFKKFPEELAVIFIAFLTFYYLYILVGKVSTFTIDGLTVKGGKLEATNHGSVLHKNIDEIIYCFERSDIDVVFIEDLDRFGIQDVFFRLREINFIIRHSPQIDRPIYFVYAVREEFFGTGEKTKFFDIVIPVIPVVNSENSKEKLNELLSQRSFNSVPLNQKLDRVLVETVSYYIDDMRLIKNIVNEFDMYASILAENVNLNANKLFAIIAIRNLYPQQYADLVKRKGIIYQAFELFGKWKTDHAQQLQKEIQALRDEIETRKSLLETNTEELRILVWHDFIKRAGVPLTAHIGKDQNQNFAFSDFIADENFEALTKDEVKLNAFDLSSGYRANRFGNPVSAKELMNHGSPSFRQRIKSLTADESALEEKIRTRLKELTGIKNASFKEAISHDSFFGKISAHFAGMGAMTYLVKSNYFSEDYADYFGYFYKGSLSLSDKNLLLALREGKSLEVGVSVDDAYTVLNKLSHGELREGRGLLAAFIDCLYGDSGDKFHDHIREEHLVNILDDCFAHLPRVIELIEMLLDKESLPNFINAVYRHKPALFQAILKHCEAYSVSLSRQQIIINIVSALKHNQLIQLQNGAETGILSFIEGLEDATLLIPHLEETSWEGWNWLRKTPVRFHRLDGSNSAETIRKLVGWGYIRLNLSMLKLIYTKLNRYSVTADYDISYQWMRYLEIDGFDELVDKDPAFFVSQILQQSGNINESPESLKILLQKLEDNDELAEQLIERTQAVIEKLEGVPENFYTLLFEKDRIQPNRENVYLYFKTMFEETNDPSEEDQAALLKFLSNHGGVLKQHLWIDPNESMNRLQTFILQKDELEETIIEELFSNAGPEVSVLLHSQISKDRWGTLVSLDTMPFELEIGKVITSAAPEHLGRYLINNWADAWPIDLEELELDTLLEITRSDAGTVSQNIQLWSKVPFSAIEELEGAKLEILRLCELGNHEGVHFPPSSHPLLQDIAMDASLPSAKRSEALIQLLSTVKWSTISSVLASFQDEGYKQLAKSERRFEVPDNQINTRLLTALKGKDYIGSLATKNGRIRAWSKPSTHLKEKA